MAIILDDTAAVLVGPWLVTNFTSGYGGFHRAAPAGAGNCTASWVFSGLSAGEYDVWVTWAAGQNRATNVPYTVNGGSPVVVNQEISPSDLVAEGTAWKYLGRYTIGGTSIAVQMANTTQEYACADAARIEFVGNPPTPTPAPSGLLDLLLADAAARRDAAKAAADEQYEFDLQRAHELAGV